MIIIAIVIGCIIGALIGINAPVIPYTYSTFLAIAVVAALDRTGGYLDTLRTQYGIKATITKQEKVTIPKYTGVIKFNYAKSR